MSEPRNKQSEDYLLVREALKGKEAFARLVGKYQGRVYHVAFQILRNQADAQDITQETFIRAYESLKKFDPHHSFVNWVRKIAVNLSLNALRKRKRLPLPLENASEYPEKEPEQRPAFPMIAKEKILGAMDTLRPKYRIAFILFHIEKCSYRQISSIMDAPVSSVKNYLFRARRKLRKKLSAELSPGAAGGN